MPVTKLLYLRTAFGNCLFYKVNVHSKPLYIQYFYLYFLSNYFYIVCENNVVQTKTAVMTHTLCVRKCV